ncbi:two-partner secretion domain-containing protein [Pandoraea iniqua]|uniref:two-partner secretion domain-containing protein n=1 Tax=Pandoraea iniqua TaxID=2508288 RepID=UPI001583A5B7|nr:ShlB/FhaC/HecB family hemolysin secretion/activation protein [Pandoraea iniqua]
MKLPDRPDSFLFRVAAAFVLALPLAANAAASAGAAVVAQPMQPVALPELRGLRDATRQGVQDQRLEQQRRETEERERRSDAPDVRLSPDAPVTPGTPPAPDAAQLTTLPAEAPCVVLRDIAVTSVDGTPVPASFTFLRRALAPFIAQCAGAAGVAQIATFATDAVLAKGWLTTRVLVPEQNLTDGHLTLLLIPGVISAVRFSDPDTRTLWRAALPVSEGDVLSLAALEQGLEQLKRMPSQDADIRIEPGELPGTSVLVIDTQRRRAWRLLASVDNSGTRDTGRLQGQLALGIDNVLGLNDLLDVAVQHDLSTGDDRFGAKGGSLSYSFPWGYNTVSLFGSRHQRTRALRRHRLRTGLRPGHARPTRHATRGSRHRRTRSVRRQRRRVRQCQLRRLSRQAALSPGRFPGQFRRRRLLPRPALLRLLMNQRCFRLVFSHVRRQWIAVGEHVRRGRTPGASRSLRRRAACGREGASAIVTTTVTAGYRQRTVATLLAFTVLGFSAQAYAQIVAAPGPHAPGVSVTPNGLPLVNITAPTAGGVSHNQYQQFDVPTQGAILNNARTIVQTQTGGWVPGNPNLTGDPARIILNQVTSALPSNLAGYLEVAGSRAEVIVSNPNGITCNGCGFINTSRGVLTTGFPVFGGSGSLEAFRVTEGAIRVTGNGLNAGNLTHAALLARAIEVNAAIHAPTLDVVTGRNEIDATTFDVRSTEGTASGAPAFALDVSRLGGMYAGKIRLIGTEAGVGVNIDGDISANGGTLTLTSAGELRIDGKVHAGEVLDATAADTPTATPCE